MKQTPTKQEQNNNRGIQDTRYKIQRRNQTNVQAKT
jgi:hypothetical protein